MECSCRTGGETYEAIHLEYNFGAYPGDKVCLARHIIGVPVLHPYSVLRESQIPSTASDYDSEPLQNDGMVSREL